MKITADKAVSAEYELYVDGEVEGELELMEKATAEQPLSFIYGVNMMLPKFESNLFGLQAGDKFDFTIEKEDAYDRKLENNINQIAKIVNAQKFADTTELRKFNLSINEIIILRQKKIDIFKKLYKILKR